MCPEEFQVLVSPDKGLSIDTVCVRGGDGLLSKDHYQPREQSAALVSLLDRGGLLHLMVQTLAYLRGQACSVCCLLQVIPHRADASHPLKLASPPERESSPAADTRGHSACVSLSRFHAS